MTRRDVLRAAGGLALLLPALEACGRAGGSGAAGENIGRSSQKLTATPTRFIGNLTPYGFVPESYWPTGSETSFQLGEILQPLERHKSNLIVLKGIENVAANYCPVEVPNGDSHTPPMITMLTGVPGTDHADYSIDHQGMSIDQVIADDFEKRGVILKKRSLQLATNAFDFGAYSFPASGPPLSALNDPAAVFQMLFDDPTATAAEIAKLRARRKSVLDGSSSAYEKLATKVSGEDKKRIEAHLDAVRDVEKRIFVGNSCSLAGFDLPAAYANDGERRKTMLDLTVLALSCDATRVATMAHWGSGGNTFSWMGVTEDLHPLSHDIVGTEPGSLPKQKFTKILNWLWSTTADFIDKLKAVVLPDGTTLFDSTVLVGMSDISYDHAWTDTPFLILAGDKTPFRTGRFVTMPTSVPHNHLLVTLLNAFGVNVTAFGDPRWASGNLNAQLLA